MSRLLDLFCGAGGCSVGYHRAGFTDIVGVDNRRMPRYTFEFHQADALEYLAAHGREFDVIHASPQCQGYSRTQRIHGREYPMIIESLRDALLGIGKPYVIENVPGAPLINPIMLCGTMFGLRVFRHRLFETMPFLLAPGHTTHHEPACIVGRQPEPGQYMTVAGHFANVAYARQAIGIDWMTRYELSQAIPPAYTEWLGRRLLEAINDR
jgi:DNA (cytosine-5)-methyltransferase 1